MKEYKSTIYYGGLESLAKAIVMQAVTDYTQALKTLASFADSSPNEKEMFAVIKQQAKKQAMKNLEIYPKATYEQRLTRSMNQLLETKRKDMVAIKESIEHFFLGDWFSWLTDCDGQAIIDEVNRQVKEWQKN